MEGASNNKPALKKKKKNICSFVVSLKGIFLVHSQDLGHALLSTSKDSWSPAFVLWSSKGGFCWLPAQANGFTGLNIQVNFSMTL